jgi:hypothetical protein
MFLIRKVAKRTKGNGLKIPKFHGILHMADETNNFGVPSEFDTGDNESHHIPAKHAAVLTQRTKEEFETSTAKRLIEKEVLDLALMESKGMLLWHYRRGTQFEVDSSCVAPEDGNESHETQNISLGGRAFYTRTDPVSGIHMLRSVKKSKAGKPMPHAEQDLIDFLATLKIAVKDHINKVTLRTKHTRDGTIFRASFDYRGHIWRDWVIVDWGRDGKLPNKLWGFVDFRGLPANLPRHSQINFGGIANIQPSICAIVEAAELSPEVEGDVPCALFTRLHTEVGGMRDGYVSKMKFYLADAEAFTNPCIVVPNLGGQSNSYFWVQNRDSWAEGFTLWLREPHHWDIMHGLNSDDDSESE